MDIAKTQKLIDTFLALPVPPEPELTIFSIGGRGYYENPTTAILAFFCNPDGPHQFDVAVIEALFDCLKIGERPQSLQLSKPPVCEQPTGGGRIDLLLEGNDWVLVLENKIFHQQNNPFADYKAYAEKSFSEKAHKLYVVLSPEGRVPEEHKDWQGISYVDLIEKLKEKMAGLFFQHQVNKWFVFLRDFILNLEQVMTDLKKVPDEYIGFFLNNLSNLNVINEEKNRAMQSLQVELHASLQEQFPEKPIIYNLETWYGFPALRFYFEGMQDKSPVVLFFDGRKENAFSIWFYVCEIKNDEQRTAADKAMDFFGKSDNYWDESHKTIRGYSKDIPNIEIVTMKETLKDILVRLDYFEKEVRPKW